ncbi:tRNA uridine-5-carboxymethylaminomethyl modification enzyme MnmG/GidA [Acidicapsa dinghuensis]|uniref:tRNA uridine 5-carboxymethylaminomethyl modification enzyme MnmG n=1 Tax=Acidicapsa dinghuensis TaxID=2218256 RepID=A0ABW1EH85_9BACT|nr:tRNA uridine-5-carboxymethylaminomethyl(34) synthesis enzyme MnmG [Acidicapsa dinghuensis]
MGFTEEFDVAVVGAGHAGCEAAMAAARMGLKTALITMNLDLIAQMSCNPAIGGIAKGHLVREVDALGGVMGVVADAVGIQFRLLNTSRGPAVWSPRAQCDKAQYRVKMREVLEGQRNLHIKQAEVTDLVLEEVGRDQGSEIRGRVAEDARLVVPTLSAQNAERMGHPADSVEGPGTGEAGTRDQGSGTSEQKRIRKVLGLKLRDGRRLMARATVITTGTFLNGLIHCGEERYPAGRSGEPASVLLGEALRRLGLRTCRLKTGTPPRLDGRTIRWEAFAEQPGDADPTPFSFRTTKIVQPQVSCHIAYTTPRTLEIIRENVGRSAMYSGQIEGVGPRYCPSIEDKIVKFPDKTQHQFFLEPEGLNTHEVYVNGMSTSLPMEVQAEIVRSIPGLEDAEMLRPGYAIEYDAVDATELDRALKVKCMEGLYLAGQINGTSGYEEAACQGLMAGINAALWVKGEAPFTLDRTEGYTGILIDDLISKGTNEPYRMFTSRAEFRLHLRIDNADRRLTAYGRKLGLVDDATWAAYERKQERMAALEKLLKTKKANAIEGPGINHPSRDQGPANGGQGSKIRDQATEDGGLVVPTLSAESAERMGHPVSLVELVKANPGATWAVLLKRPEVTIDRVLPALVNELRSDPLLVDYALISLQHRTSLSHLDDKERHPDIGHPDSILKTEDAVARSVARNEAKAVETEIKFAGYLEQQKKAIEKLKAAEGVRIPEWLDYSVISGLSREMQEKLGRVRPETIGQASRIPGVTPAALGLVHVSIRIQGEKRARGPEVVVA